MPSEPGSVDAPRASTTVLACGAVVLIAAGILCAVWTLHPYHHKFDLIDLAVYRAAGKALVHGHSVYGPYVAEQLHVRLPFIYPPIGAALAAPLTLLSERPANIVWTIVTVALLVAVVGRAFAPVLAQFRRPVAVASAWVLVVGAVLALSPVQEHLRFGQVGIPLMACCFFDCIAERPRWPRGLLIGVATAFKLVPGIFIPYLALSRRWRAAGVAVGTFVGLSLIGFLVAPSDSWSFWTDRIFEPTSPTFFSNQSLEGILQRAIGPWRPFWLLAVAAILVFGLWRAAVASLGGDELRGVAITGLIGALVSPISWIHHLVWVVPALAVIVNRTTTRKQAFVVLLVAMLFVVRLPYVGNDELHGHGLFAGLLEDSYGLVCLGLLLYLGDAVPLARRGIAARRAATSV